MSKNFLDQKFEKCDEVLKGFSEDFCKLDDGINIDNDVEVVRNVLNRLKSVI